MKKFLLSVFCTLYSVLLFAGNPGFGERKYTVTGLAEYSYNATWKHHANFDVQALMPFNPHFEMEAKVQLSTANVYTGYVQLRPKFALPVGEMFLETGVMYRAVKRNTLGDFTAALGVGYRMDYVSVTIGMFGRVIDDWQRDWHSTESYVTEPFNLLYRLEVYCRPQANVWNLWFSFSNIDDHQMERMWQPLFGIGAWYNVTEHWRVLLDAQCKPTGMFHLDATFYGATVRAGFSYRF